MCQTKNQIEHKNIKALCRIPNLNQKHTHTLGLNDEKGVSGG